MPDTLSILSFPCFVLLSSSALSPRLSTTHAPIHHPQSSPAPLPQDVFDFQRERRLTTLVLPPTAYVRVGHVVRTFPKASVVVVAIAQPLRVGDIVCLQRIKSTFEPVALGEDADAHRWRSEQVGSDLIVALALILMPPHGYVLWVTDSLAMKERTTSRERNESEGVREPMREEQQRQPTGARKQGSGHKW